MSAHQFLQFHERQQNGRQNEAPNQRHDDDHQRWEGLCENLQRCFNLPIECGGGVSEHLFETSRSLTKIDNLDEQWGETALSVPADPQVACLL